MTARSMAVIAFLMASTGAMAAGPVADPAELKLRGLRAEPLRGTFIVRHPASEKIGCVAGDLQETTRGTGLVGMQANAVREAEADGIVRDRVTVSVPVPPKAGSFSGAITCDGLASKVSVSAVFDPIPSVDTEVSSKSVVFHLRSGDGTQQTQEIVLLQGGEGEFKVNGAAVSAIKRGDRVLPGGAVKVTTGLPLSSKTGSAEVQLTGVGTGATAGEFAGSVHLRVESQDNRVQVPVKVFVKDGPLLPFLVLLLGVLAAWFLGWWNAGASAANYLVRAARRLQASIQRGQGLQSRERERCYELVRDVLQSVELGEPVAEGQKKLEAAEAAVNKARGEADAVIQRLRGLQEGLDGARAAVRVHSELLGTVEETAASIRSGSFDTLGDAVAETDVLQNEIAALQALLVRYQALSPVVRSKVAKTLAEAPSLQAATSIVDQAEQSGAPVPVAAGTSTVSGSPPSGRGGRRIPRLPREQLLRVSAFGVAALTYVFVLVVGWLSIYVASDTFGADPMQYVTLFLWGVTVETVRGKTVTLSALQGLVPGRRPI
jgi:hypothetical protein